MAYSVKEVFYTLQGEGHNSGRAAVFCRFSGCNLWSGRPEDRSGAICKFCDTDFVGVDGDGGGKFTTANALASHIATFWPLGSNCKPFVVCTGGEPLLQIDQDLIAELHRAGFSIAIETNGTIAAPEGVDWVCVSPKHGTELKTVTGNEIKVVFPQETNPREYERFSFDHYFIQAMDGPSQAENLKAALKFCMDNPKWRLSLQTHKLLQIR
jgi:7-carboxy-7-deazaguanine synthase